MILFSPHAAAIVCTAFPSETDFNYLQCLNGFREKVETKSYIHISEKCNALHLDKDSQFHNLPPNTNPRYN